MFAPVVQLSFIFLTIVHSQPINDAESTTQYSPEVTVTYAQSIEQMHWLHDGFHSTVLSQLDGVHRHSNVAPSKMSVIDIACGGGQYSRFLADHFGYARIVGVDLSQNQVDLARNRTAQFDQYSNIEFFQMGVPSDDDISKLGGPFDIAVANWLFNYADTKRELFDYAQWVSRVLKPGGLLIGWTVSIDDIRDADDGALKNDPSFLMQTLFDSEKKEGRVLEVEDAMSYVNNLWTFDTYRTVFEVAGYRGLRFLEHHEYIGNTHFSNNSTRAERAKWEEVITWKGTVLKALMANKEL